MVAKNTNVALDRPEHSFRLTKMSKVAFSASAIVTVQQTEHDYRVHKSLHMCV